MQNPQYLNKEEEQKIDIGGEVERLYLVKWRNLSYADSTWEAEKDINSPGKVADFKRFKALNPQARKQMTDLTANFVKYMEQLVKQKTSKKYKHFIAQSRMTSIARALNFPTHNSKQLVVQCPSSPYRDYSLIEISQFRYFSEV